MICACYCAVCRQLRLIRTATHAHPHKKLSLPPLMFGMPHTSRTSCGKARVVAVGFDPKWADPFGLAYLCLDRPPTPPSQIYNTLLECWPCVCHPPVTFIIASLLAWAGCRLGFLKTSKQERHTYKIHCSGHSSPSHDTEGIRTLAGGAQCISSPSP